MQYCFDCDGYTCTCGIDEVSINYEKENLFELMQVMNVTKEEIGMLIEWTKDGILDGDRFTYCLIGLTAKARNVNAFNSGLLGFSSYLNGGNSNQRFRPIEVFIQRNENHAQLIEWLQELL